MSKNMNACAMALIHNAQLCAMAHTICIPIRQTVSLNNYNLIPDLLFCFNYQTERLQNVNTTILMGATTSRSLFFKNRFDGIKLFTDDGSEGMKGYPTDILEELHKKPVTSG